MAGWTGLETYSHHLHKLQMMRRLWSQLLQRRVFVSESVFPAVPRESAQFNLARGDILETVRAAGSPGSGRPNPSALRWPHQNELFDHLDEWRALLNEEQHLGSSVRQR